MRRFLVLAVLAGCGSAPTGKQALEHAGPLFGFDELDAAIAVCEQKGWSGEVRTCLAKATSGAEAVACGDPVKLDMAVMLIEQSKQAVNQSDKLERDAEQAGKHAQDASDRAKTANADLERLVKESNDLADKVDTEIAAVANAHDQAQLDAANAKLDELQNQRADLKQKLDAAKAAAEQAQPAPAP